MAETAATVACMVAVLGSVTLWIALLARNRARRSATRDLSEQLADLDGRMREMSAEVTAIHRLLRDLD
ncbi:hypothetical protein [Kutzneria kofuensis]|uniref:Uncharacterized protein n=1 Tax=Kutzneria kofuensis TaxID=103725 RepID=A0A7W9KRC3_9PSEU|nr:hypothetical protein [Kutzneria kofuensis]MBB5897033.1 hypothetical protein [Kutzneria kofuensis]